jgi:hypothetical protein
VDATLREILFYCSGSHPVRFIRPILGRGPSLSEELSFTQPGILPYQLIDVGIGEKGVTPDCGPATAAWRLESELGKIENMEDSGYLEIGSGGMCIKSNFAVQDYSLSHVFQFPNFKNNLPQIQVMYVPSTDTSIL